VVSRALSTVFDTTVFLVLVSAAAVVLVAPVAPLPTADGAAVAAEETATRLATTTATVTYAPARAAAGASRRTATGTIAELLAAAALERALVEPRATDGFARAVARATRQHRSDPTVATQVRAVWTPFPAATVRGVVVAGPDPPRTASVHASTLTVPSRVDPVVPARRATRYDRYRALGRALANATVDAVLGGRAGEIALAGDAHTAATVTERYRVLAARVGVSLPADPGHDDAEVMWRRIRDALARRYAARLRRSYSSPAAAANATTAGRVRIVVRTWQP
jgi:hypothetical protein